MRLKQFIYIIIFNFIVSNSLLLGNNYSPVITDIENSSQEIKFIYHPKEMGDILCKYQKRDSIWKCDDGNKINLKQLEVCAPMPWMNDWSVEWNKNFQIVTGIDEINKEKRYLVFDYDSKTGNILTENGLVCDAYVPCRWIYNEGNEVIHFLDDFYSRFITSRDNDTQKASQMDVDDDEEEKIIEGKRQITITSLDRKRTILLDYRNYRISDYNNYTMPGDSGVMLFNPKDVNVKQAWDSLHGYIDQEKTISSHVHERHVIPLTKNRTDISSFLLEKQHETIQKSKQKKCGYFWNYMIPVFLLKLTLAHKTTKITNTYYQDLSYEKCEQHQQQKIYRLLLEFSNPVLDCFIDCGWSGNGWTGTNNNTQIKPRHITKVNVILERDHSPIDPKDKACLTLLLKRKVRWEIKSLTDKLIAEAQKENISLGNDIQANLKKLEDYEIDQRRSRIMPGRTVSPGVDREIISKIFNKKEILSCYNKIRNKQRELANHEASTDKNFTINELPQLTLKDFQWRLFGLYFDWE